ncbi:putative uncharacterized protein encoded by LINC00575 [Pongo abelii]|uniref:putative uncharacterized protein encoded by LINC00575 n=1 Tax=Pongo abelii TaxID=9601 RepID=UPI0023E8F508|nr:putative uncharacterized protein encoded by LINC00575 [Pongo abelii]
MTLCTDQGRSSRGSRLYACCCSSCPWTSDSRFFDLWTLGLAPMACRGLLGYMVSFPGFEAFRLGLSHYQLFSLPSLQAAYRGTSPCNRREDSLPLKNSS